ncbi:MAG: hypothetical protein ACRDAM_08550 [Casimicrobium sp.]
MIFAKRSSTRFFIGVALLWGTATSPISRASEPIEGLTARFHMPGGALVQLEYWDEKNYRLTPAGDAFATLVSNGKIYLEPLTVADTPTAYWIGQLLNSVPREIHVVAETGFDYAPALRPTTIPIAGQAAWGVTGAVHDVALPIASVAAAPSLTTARKDEGARSTLTVSKWSPLARAQHAIASRLPASMDMNVCGNSVRQLVASWNVGLTANGFAVLATDAGVRLDGGLTPLRQRPQISSRAMIADYRVRP